MSRPTTIGELVSENVATALDMQGAQFRLSQAMDVQRAATLSLMNTRDAYNRALVKYYDANAAAVAAAHAVTQMITEQMVNYDDASKVAAVSTGPRAIELRDVDPVEAER